MSVTILPLLVYSGLPGYQFHRTSAKGFAKPFGARNYVFHPPLHASKPGLRLISCSASSAVTNTEALSDQKQQYAVLLECDGILTDLHTDGHMAAFNRAFSELGLDCVRWTPPVYHDLLRSADGTGIGLIGAYFAVTGWPMMLATADRPAFAEKVYDLKCKHFKELMEQRSIRLRPGVRDFIDDVQMEGVKVGIITETNSTPDHRTVDAVMDLLGASSLHVRVFPSAMTCLADVEGSSSGEDSDDGELVGLTMEQQLAIARAKAKRRDAARFSNSTSREGSDAVPLIAVCPSLAVERVGSLLSSGFISAAAVTLGVPAAHTVVLAASSPVMEAAKGAGAVSIAVPPSLSARGRFPAADASYDGFGPGGGATWRRIQGLLRLREQGHRNKN